jgi:hypothetical protein
MNSSEIDKLKAKIRKQAARMIQLQSAQPCTSCHQSNAALDDLKHQSIEARQALRHEVIVNESMAAYLDRCVADGSKVESSWRLTIVNTPESHSNSVARTLASLSADEKSAMEATLKYTISDMASKAKDDMEMVVQMKADSDTKLLHTTQTNINLETDVDMYMTAGENPASHDRQAKVRQLTAGISR